MALMLDPAKVQYWNPAVGHYQFEVPTFAPGNFGGITCICENTLERTLYCRLIYEIKNPLGAVVSTAASANEVLAPGAKFAGAWGTTCDMDGAWRIKVTVEDLESGLNIFTMTLIFANVTGAPEPTPEITELEFWNNNQWSSVPPTGLPLGSTIGVRVQAKNLSSHTQYIRAVVAFIRPQPWPPEIVDSPGAYIPAGSFYTEVFLYDNTNFDPYLDTGVWTADVDLWAGDDPAHSSIVDSQDGVVIATLVEDGDGDGGLQTLEIDITPIGTGYVTTQPAPQGGYKQWVDGSTGEFPYGTHVEVTAYPHVGYVFEKWTDEIVGGTNLQNPAYVQPMTEHRAVKCHFVPVEEVLETLEVDITPVGRGYVTTVPASYEGKTTWLHNETGQFVHGTDVEVTAHPDEGYEFEKWSDQIVGGISYDNPAMVQSMTERRVVKCHFQEEGAPPDEEGLEILGLTLDGWCKLGGTLGTSNVGLALGDTLHVEATVNYTATEDFTKEIWVSLVVEPFRDETFKYNISLPQVGAPTNVVLTFDIPIQENSLKNQTYDLWVEFDGGLQDKASSAVTLSGMPEGILGGIGNIAELIGMMVMVMIMTMIMGFMQEPGTFVEKAAVVTEKVGKAAAPIIQIFTAKKEGST